MITERENYISQFLKELKEIKIKKEGEQEKKEQYREDLRNAEIDLIKGAKEFFNELKNNNIPFTIATSADKKNIELFFEKFGLNKWFDFDKCAFTDGTFKGKPNPDIYLIAAKKIGVDIKKLKRLNSQNAKILMKK